jgi:hypothetical protein
MRGVEDLSRAERAHLGLAGDGHRVQVLGRRRAVECEPARDLLDRQPFRILRQQFPNPTDLARAPQCQPLRISLPPPNI